MTYVAVAAVAFVSGWMTRWYLNRRILLQVEAHVREFERESEEIRESMLQARIFAARQLEECEALAKRFLDALQDDEGEEWKR